MVTLKAKEAMIRSAMAIYHFPIQIQLRLDSIIFRDQIELWLDYKMKIGGKLGETKLLSSETKYLCFYSNTLLSSVDFTIKEGHKD